jgi:hypothetical protein
MELANPEGTAAAVLVLHVLKGMNYAEAWPAGFGGDTIDPYVVVEVKVTEKKNAKTLKERVYKRSLVTMLASECPPYISIKQTFAPFSPNSFSLKGRGKEAHKGGRGRRQPGVQPTIRVHADHQAA